MTKQTAGTLERRATTSVALVLSVSGLALAAGCQGASEARTVPQEVADVIAANCIDCHSASPVSGAPMSLATYDAFHAAAITQPALSVYELMGTRIHDTVRPMPPTIPLSSEDMAVLDGWIASGAPPGPGPALIESMTTPVGPEHLPCEVTHEFRAHADQDLATPFRLAPGAGNGGNQTLCFVYASPFTETEQGTAFAPIIGDDRVVHHWIIFASDTLPTGVEVGDVYDCGAQGMPTGATFLTGWAPGGQNTVLPESLGRQVPGPGEYVLLQVHYWNVRNFADVSDTSGVAMCSTQTPRANEIGTATLGSLNIAIPPRANDHEVVGTCTPAITAPVTIVGSGPHMHERGVSLRTEVLRQGREDRIEMLVDVSRWDFQSQTSYPAPGGTLVIQPGDMLRTTCVYDNMGDDTVTFGERTEDEMCFNFVSAFPAGAMATERGRARGLCID